MDFDARFCGCLYLLETSGTGQAPGLYLYPSLRRVIASSGWLIEIPRMFFLSPRDWVDSLESWTNKGFESEHWQIMSL